MFQLQVRHFEQNCVFELSWGRGQRLSATLIYPESLTASYADWQRTYLSYYKSALRGRKGASASLAVLPIDWHAKLVQAEAKLLSEFHHWLRSAELFEIRAAIANNHFSDHSEQRTPNNQQRTIQLFLTCHTLELERLPWEAWEIGAEFPTFGRICFVRTPVNIHQPSVSNHHYACRKKARILVILGDETGLNFKGDRQAVSKLSRLAEIEFIGWQPGQDIPELKTKISAAIASEKGWDVLLFAGHSNETQVTGGELAIAPNASISIREITPQLQFAKERGLKFALFNSCSGLSLASSLIDLGLSQVAVMREPIHNAVAQVFLVKFMQALAEHHDVHESLLVACQSLKVEKNLTYPSTYLIPSLFGYPDTKLYRLPVQGFKEQLKQILPTRSETIAVYALSLLSLCLPVQDWLLEQRVNIQAIYRQLTGQILISASPPVLLVQIDEESLQKAGIANPKPMNRNYLARLIDQLVHQDARVVGIDYVLGRPLVERDNPNAISPDDTLAKSLKAGIQKSTSTTFIFAAIQDDYSAKWITVRPEIASPNWSFVGQIHFMRWYMSLVPLSDAPSQKLPFSYLLALANQLQLETGNDGNSPIKPQLNSETDFFSQVSFYLKSEKGKNYKTLFSTRGQLQPMTHFSYKLRQMWLHPIIDFSIPPEQVYQSIPAWQLLESRADSPQFSHLEQQVVIIVPGGYGEAGVYAEGQDRFPVPPAIKYWFNQALPAVQREKFTGGEVHAYMIHHFLNRRLVVPIPDLWLIGVAVLLGKLTTTIGKNVVKQNRQFWWMLIIGTSIYGLVSLQVYLSAGVLLPWLLPTVTFCTYVFPLLLRKKFHRF